MDYYYMELAEFLSNMVTIHQSNNEACACVPCCGLSGSSQHWSQMVREKDKPLKKSEWNFSTFLKLSGLKRKWKSAQKKNHVNIECFDKENMLVWHGGSTLCRFGWDLFQEWLKSISNYHSMQLKCQNEKEVSKLGWGGKAAISKKGKKQKTLMKTDFYVMVPASTSYPPATYLYNPVQSCTRSEPGASRVYFGPTVGPNCTSQVTIQSKAWDQPQQKNHGSQWKPRLFQRSNPHH